MGCWRERAAPWGIAEWVTVPDLCRLPGGVAVIAGKCGGWGRWEEVTPGDGVITPASAVGLVTHSVMRSRKAGRAEYAPLRRYKGGGGRKPTYREKNANTDVCVFFYFSALGYGRGLPLPL
jgi:hypothetical protein